MKKDIQHARVNKYDKYFYTEDFDLAISLLCTNYIIETIDTRRDGKNVFVFRNDNDVEKHAMGLSHKRITVNESELIVMRQILKSRISDARRVNN